MWDHRRRHREGKENQRCLECLKQFRSQSDRDKHVASAHEKPLNSTTVKSNVSNDLARNGETIMETNLSRTSKQLGAITDDSTASNDEEVERTTGKSVGKLQCDLCPFSANNRKWLVEHLKSKH